MSLNLIHDTEQIKKFEEMFYTVEKPEIFLLYIATRKKYCNELSNNENGCFKKRIINYTNIKCRLVTDIQKYMVPHNSYMTKDYSRAYPSESLVIYGSLNARNAKKAAESLSKEIISKAFEQDEEYYNKIDCYFKSFLQKFSYRKYIGIDLDTKDCKIYNSLKCDISDIGIKIYAIIETHGGYHIIINIDQLKSNKEGAKLLYTVLNKKYIHLDKIDNDLFSPIPGTIQGGFNVKFVDI